MWNKMADSNSSEVDFRCCTADLDKMDTLLEELKTQDTTNTHHQATIDKKGLAKAVKLQDGGIFENFTWKKQIPFTELELRAIKVQGLGDIPVPVSLQDVQKLKEISERAQFGKGFNKSVDPSLRQAWEIDSLKLLDNVDLPLLVTPHLDFPAELLNVQIQAKLDKLLLFETAGHYKRNMKSEKEFGTFGTTTLQLPVEGGHEGGRLNVDYKGKSKILENDHQSGEHFYVSTICSCCNEVMEPITSGWRLTLVFDLVWINAKTRLPIDFPIFLTALREIEATLTPWIPNRRTVDNRVSKEEPFTRNSDLLNVQYSKDKQTDVVIDSSEDELDGLSGDEDTEFLNKEACKEDVLFFVLQEKYEENEISFQNLRGKDRYLAQLLQSSGFLDVHLAMVTCNILRDGYYGRANINELKSAEVSRWIDSNDVVRNLSLKRLHWKKQRVGSNRNFLATFRQLRNGRNSKTRKNYGTVMRQHDFYHCILVIWPKHQSIQMYCRYGPNLLLDRMESSLKPLYKENARQEVTGDLGKIISFCYAEPLQVWKPNSQQAERKGEFTLKLLRLCTVWRAREEGLTFLKVLGTDYVTSEEHSVMETTFFEGIQSEEVAQAIVDFESQVTGWESCAKQIRQMISPTRILPQFLAIIKLAQYLLDANCLDGAMMVADCISSTITNVDKPQTTNLKQSDVDAFLDLILSLETSPKTSNLVRLVSFISLFPKLDPSVQCSVVLQLDYQCNSRLKGIESCELLLKDLSKSLSENYHLHSNSVLDSIENLICCYIRLGNSEWLLNLISSVCRPSSPSRGSDRHIALSNAPSSPLYCPTSPAYGSTSTSSYTPSSPMYVPTSPYYDPNSPSYNPASSLCDPSTLAISSRHMALKKSLLAKLLSSSIIWDFATLSKIGKLAMASIVNEQLSLVVNELSDPQPPYFYECNSDLLALSKCINYAMRLERNPQLEDPNCTSSIPSLLAKLDIQLLCDLVVQVHNSGSESFKEHPSDFAIFNQICELLLARMNDEPAYFLTRAKGMKVLKCLTQLNNQVLARALIKRMCENEVADSSGDKHSKCEFYRDLMSSTDVWGNVYTDSKVIVLNSLISLFELWMGEIREMFDSDLQYSLPSVRHLKMVVRHCIELFKLIELYRLGPEQKNVSQSFPAIFEKLLTSHLMDLVLDIHQSEAKIRPNFKNYSNCLEWYRSMCRVLFAKEDLVSIVSTGALAIKVAHCLVWLADDECWQSFAQHFCKSFPSDQSHHFVLVFVNNFVVHHALCNSPPAICAFNLIVDHLKKPTSVMKEPPFTWQQPQAVVSGHADVQTFLRGNEEKMTYQNFSSIVEAREFAIELERNGPTNGFSVRASATGSAHNSRVTISKNKNHHFQAVKAFQNKQSELKELFNLHQSLQEHLGINGEVDTLASKTVASEEMRSISSPAKRRKLENHVAEVEID